MEVGTKGAQLDLEGVTLPVHYLKFTVGTSWVEL